MLRKMQKMQIEGRSISLPRKAKGNTLRLLVKARRIFILPSKVVRKLLSKVK